jgi:hypothetical protein
VLDDPILCKRLQVLAGTLGRCFIYFGIKLSLVVTRGNGGETSGRLSCRIFSTGTEVLSRCPKFAKSFDFSKDMAVTGDSVACVKDAMSLFNIAISLLSLSIPELLSLWAEWAATFASSASLAAASATLRDPSTMACISAVLLVASVIYVLDEQDR